MEATIRAIIEAEPAAGLRMIDARARRKCGDAGEPRATHLAASHRSRHTSRMPIARNSSGRLWLQLGDGATQEGVLETLVSAFEAKPGKRSDDRKGNNSTWQELRIGGFRFTMDWDRWKGCGVVSEEPAGDETLRRIAVWFQEDREVW